MFTVTKQFRFEAAHFLPLHDGQCKQLHGHSWLVDVTLRGEQLHHDGPKKGMLVDYADLSLAMDPIIKQLDHTCLNDSVQADFYPTSENLARWIYWAILFWFPEPRFKLAITVHETCSAKCTYEQSPLLIPSDGLFHV